MSFPSLPRLDSDTPIAQTSDLFRERPAAILEGRDTILVPGHVRRFAEMINQMTTGDLPPQPWSTRHKSPVGPRLGRGSCLTDREVAGNVESWLS